MAREAHGENECGAGSVNSLPGAPAASSRTAAAIIRSPLRNATAAALRLALGTAQYDVQPRDWSRVFAVASGERLAVIAWLRSGEYIRAFAPKQVVAPWRAAAFQADDLARAQGARLCDLVTSLHAEGLHPIVLKGLPLATRLYGYAAARVSCDIDLFIPAEERAAAHEVVCGTGWEHWVGQPPWDSAYSVSDRGRVLYLELHSALGGDLLTHCGPLPLLTQPVEYDGTRLTALSGPTLSSYLAANLVKHTPAPLISCLDFNTLWSRLTEDEKRAAYSLTRAARLRRCLEWAIAQGTAVIDAAQGEPVALRRLGIGFDERRAAHGHARLMWLADSPVDAARVLGTWLLPRPARSSLRTAGTFWRNRLRGSLTGKLIQRRSHTANAHFGEYGGRSIIARIVESSVPSEAQPWSNQTSRRTS
jgi:hypothetical protein